MVAGVCWLVAVLRRSVAVAVLRQHWGSCRPEAQQTPAQMRRQWPRPRQWLSRCPLLGGKGVAGG